MKRAFTLIEILVVVTIIMLLTATAVVSYTTFLKTSRDAKRKADLGQISAALEMYRSNVDPSSYPVALTNLTAPIIYIQSVLSDPKSPSYSYYYNAVDSAGGTCDGSASDPCASYTLGAHLESVPTTCQSLTTNCTSNCTYCLGPYGQKP